MPSDFRTYLTLLSKHCGTNERLDKYTDFDTPKANL